ncbi:MAG: c-type cytochrome, partial [Acidobacteria bacterium]|nr:c-type cytochrome [Acidobacteriota bacterium]
MVIKFGLALLILAAQAAAQSDAVAAGAVRFRIYCSECHGRLGRGGRGPDLASGRWTHGGNDEDIARTIAKGVPGAGMPAFGDQWDQNDIRELVAFIRSLAAGAGAIQVTGNAENGRQIYWGKGACSGCHMIAGRGGRLGPDLTRIGAQRALAGLKESIVTPSADSAE